MVLYNVVTANRNVNFSLQEEIGRVWFPQKCIVKSTYLLSDILPLFDSLSHLLLTPLFLLSLCFTL